MAIRVRCRHCRKKISMDDAFAGGVCRCPYCGALNMAGGQTGADQASGDRPERPDAPGLAGASKPIEAAEAAAEHIPVASPVKVQGIVAMVVIALLLLMLAAAGTVGYFYYRGQQPPPEPTNVFAKPGKRVVDATFDPPVVYVLDASSGTGDLFNMGVAIVRHSIRSLDADDKVRLLLVTPEGVVQAAEKWIGGGADGDAAAKKLLAGRQPYGATDLAAGIAKAIELKPNVVVLLAGKEPARDQAGLDALCQAGAGAGVKLFCVNMGDYEGSEVTRQMRQLCEKTGGSCQAFVDWKLIGLLSEAPLLP